MTRYSKPEYLTDFSDDPTIWTRRFGDEFWADAYTPLSYCLLRHWISNISLPPSKKVHNKFRYHKGFAYISSEYWLDVMSGVPPASRLSTIRAYLCKSDQDRFDNLPTRIWASLVSLLKLTPLLQESPTDSITKNHVAMAAWQAETAGTFHELMEKDLSAPDLDELLRVFTAWKEKGDYHFVLLRAGLSAWGPLLMQALEKLLEKWISESTAKQFNLLMGGLPGSLTLETNKDMYELAAAASAPELREIMQAGDGASRIIQYIEAHPGDDFSKQFCRFIRKYRHRGASREMIADRWEERPEMVIDLMQGFMGVEALHDPLKEAAEKKRAREAFQAEILDSLQKEGGSFIKTRLFNWLLNKAQIYYVYRENQRFILDQILYALKRVSLEIGLRYTRKGLLDQHHHVFFLFEDELFDLATGPAYREEIKQDAARRSAQYPSQVGNFPSTFLQGNREFEEAEESGQEAAENGSGQGEAACLEGLAVSPGRVSGRARVITRIEEIGLIQKGEILVSSNTDPAWTPAFINLSGLVMETGGVLCHGAIVSREYGIPAVTFISRATRIIKTGQQIEVDGDAGQVRVLD